MVLTGSKNPELHQLPLPITHYLVSPRGPPPGHPQGDSGSFFHLGASEILLRGPTHREDRAGPRAGGPRCRHLPRDVGPPLPLDTSQRSRAPPPIRASDKCLVSTFQVPGAISGHLGHIRDKIEEKEKTQKQRQKKKHHLCLHSVFIPAQGRGEGQRIKVRDMETMKDMT